MYSRAMIRVVLTKQSEINYILQPLQKIFTLTIGGKYTRNIGQSYQLKLGSPVITPI